VPALSFSSALAASPEQVWEHASSFAGVNEELWPVHMSGGRSLRINADTPVGRPLLRSVVSLFGVVPLDLHVLTFAEVWNGRGFRESSHSLLHRRWIHVRRIEATEGGGCVVHDELRFEPRVLPELSTQVIRRVFVRRHHRLRQKFGVAKPAARENHLHVVR
jgi:hypothetical protein